VVVFAVVDQYGFLLAVEAFVAVAIVAEMAVMMVAIAPVMAGAAVAIVEEMVVMVVAIAPVMAGAAVAIAVQGEAIVMAGLGLVVVA